MKNSIKILSLCVVMMFVFAGVSMAKTNTEKLNEKSVKTGGKKTLCYSKSGMVFEIEFGGKCDNAIKAFEGATELKVQACAGKDTPDALCKAATDSQTNSKAAMEDCLNTNKESGFLKGLKIVADAVTGIFKINVTITTDTKKTETKPTTGGGTLQPDTPATPIEPISPFDIID